jgi:hypothetical protein
MVEEPCAGMHDATARLGEVLVCIGAMTEDQIDQVLSEQRRAPEKLFGRIAIEMGFISNTALDRLLGQRAEAEEPSSTTDSTADAY